jgi:cell division protease FtsH
VFGACHREIRSKIEQHLRTLQASAEDIVRRHRNAVIAVALALRDKRHLLAA